MVRAFLAMLFLAVWLVLLLYTQGGPISVVTGGSRDIFFPPLVEGKEESSSLLQNSAQLDADIPDGQEAPPEAAGTTTPEHSRAAQVPVAGSTERKRSKSRLAYARFPKTGSRYAMSRLWQVAKFSVVPERKAVRAVGVAADEFLLGSVRNPCTSYLSLWAFQSESSRRAGLMVDLRQRDPQAYTRLVGRDSASGFTGPEDVQRFRDWIKFLGHPEAKLGLLSGRFHGKFLSQDPKMDILNNAYLVRGLSKEAAEEAAAEVHRASIYELADCWLHTESLDTDLTLCCELRICHGLHSNHIHNDPCT